MRGDAQRDILDAFADADGDRAAVAEAHGTVSQLRREMEALERRRDEVRRRADYLRHVVAEIDRAKLQAGEDARLEQDARRLGQASTLSGHAARLAEALGDAEGGAQEAMSRAERALGALERVDEAVASWRELLEAARANLDELVRAASLYAEEVQDDPERLAEVERRRDVLFGLMQKYGTDVDAVLAARAEAAAELDVLDTAELDLRSLGARREAAEAALATSAGRLSERRRQAAEKLARAVNRWLPRLGLPGGKLSVALDALAEIQSHGAESVAFLVQINAGIEARPLARVASGGERSRLMLALKVVLARQDAVPSLVFDEVDQGIGGEVGAQVAEALGEVAARHQVLVITHLPQIAARADQHLVVTKRPRGGIATSDVARVFGEDRVLELARMLGDAEGDAARRHARALLDQPAAPCEARHEVAGDPWPTTSTKDSGSTSGSGPHASSRRARSRPMPSNRARSR
jgi:DNA repair protein RecN (Recombination protein N)